MRRRRKQRPRWIPLTLTLVVVGGGAWWWFGWRGDAVDTAEDDGESQLVGHQQADDELDPEIVPTITIGEPVEESRQARQNPAPPADEELVPVGVGDAAQMPEMPAAVADDAGSRTDEAQQARGSAPRDAGRPEQDSSERYSSNPRINASLQRYHAGEVLEARRELNRMLQISNDAAERAELRRHLQTIADATVFSRSGPAGDPLVEDYTIRSGDYLVRIAPRFDVPHEVVMMVNGIQDAARIRAGQKLRIPRGPFHAVVDMSDFRIDVFLQDTFVRSFPVGLGKEPGTPTGEWRVKNRLENPTYYPSASSDIDRIIPGNDPENPLGEHWIGLEGVSGNAVGHEGYGIHGTIEPESIGQAVSLGCIRMHNEDVAFVYQLLLPGKSKVTTRP